MGRVNHLYKRDRRRAAAAALLLAALTFAVYRPAERFAFLSYDDISYVTENPMVRGGLTPAGLAWAFRSREYAGNWHPLAWISHMIDVRLFGTDAGRHHRTNIALHALTAALLLLVLNAACGALGPSAAGAALFALHPLHVEAVAWVAERKELLAALFWMLAMAAHLRYVRRPEPRRMLPVIIGAAGAFLSKPMAVTLPCALLLLDFWPLGRFAVRGRFAPRWGPVLEKLPLFALAALTAAMTMQAQRLGGAMQMLAPLPLAVRIGNGIAAYAFYLKKTIWPAELAILYRHAERMPETPVLLAAGVLLAAMTLCSVLELRRRPWLAAGWAWYLGTLVPVLGLVQFGRQGMADRYTHLPQIGIFLIAVWAGRECAGKIPRGRTMVLALAVLTLVSLACLTRRQLSHWQDTGTLFRHALAIDPGNDMAHLSLAIHLHKAGAVEEAVPHYQAAIRGRPQDPEARLGLGLAYSHLGRMPEEIEAYKQAIAVAPGFRKAYVNLGIAYRDLGMPREAAWAEGMVEIIDRGSPPPPAAGPRSEAAR